MKEVEYFNWWLPPDEWSKKPRKSTWKMTVEDAAARGLDRPVDGTREVRLAGETPEEEEEYRRKMSTGAWLKTGPKGS